MSYTTVKLPVEFLAENIDPLVNEKNGYSSRAEVIKDAIRVFIASRKPEQKNEETEIEPIKN